MKPGAMFGILLAIVVVAFGVYMIDFDVHGEAKLPDVDVAVEEGELPEVDAEVGDVDVGSKEVTVEVPDVEVTPPGDKDEETEVVQN
jgi:hypothetical protein